MELQEKKHLSPLKYPQEDLFIADIFDAISIQLDMASMEFPLFALKSGDKNIREYSINNFSISIVPSVKYGLATIHDKDIWIYCVSKLMQAIREEKPINRTINFTIYDYLVTTNRSTGGSQYEYVKYSLERLKGTTITTDIKTDDMRTSEGFGLIDHWKIIEEKDGRMIRISVTLPEWLYRSITSKSVLTISPDYFRLRKPLDRRIYEIARKHCGNNRSWTFDLSTLKDRSGSMAKMFEFRRAIKSLAKSNQLPDYSVEYAQDRDQVIFSKRVDISAVSKEIKQEIKNTRKRITEYEAGRMAHAGESWESLLKRIGKDYHVIFDNKE